MSGQQIYDNFHTARGPGGLQQTRHNLHVVMKKYEIRSRQVSSLIASMQEGWTGGASDTASQSVGRLASAHADAATAMNTANDLIESQSQAFYDTKNKVVPVPDIPETPPAIKELVGDPNGGWSQAAKVAAANSASKQNVEAMTSWATTSGDNGAQMPTTYGTLDAGVLGVTQGGAQPGVSVGSGVTGNGPSLGGTGGASRGGGAVTGGTSSLSGGAPYQAPTGQVPPEGRTVASDAAFAPQAPGAYSPNVPQQGGHSTGYGTSNGYGVPGGYGYGTNAGHRGGATPGGGRGGATPGGGSYGRGGSAGAGASRGFGPGSNPLGDGKRFGAGNPAAAGESVARGGGAAGRNGTAGSPGGMGAGAGNRGKGEDGGEHRRKYIVDEDEHFQLTAEGEKAVDPITGMTVSPPVLGQ
jgi:hypothetical protein